MPLSIPGFDRAVEAFEMWVYVPPKFSSLRPVAWPMRTWAMDTGPHGK